MVHAGPVAASKRRVARLEQGERSLADAEEGHACNVASFEAEASFERPGGFLDAPHRERDMAKSQTVHGKPFHFRIRIEE